MKTLIKTEDLGYCQIDYYSFNNKEYKAIVYKTNYISESTGWTNSLSGCEWMAANIATDILKGL